jgi:hypothetical protein
MYLAVPTTRSGKGSSSEAVEGDLEDEESVETNGSKSKKK